MEEKAINKRNWVKNIAIIFLSVMLVLTLFSNTIMNYSLPEVSAQYVYSGTITTRIRGSGTVEANETYSVLSPSSSTIKDIGIKVGQHVAIGDVMFLLENEKDINLIAVLEELAAFKTEYNTLLESLGGNYLDMQLAISEAQSALTEARSKRTAADKAKEQLVGVTAAYNAAKKLYEKLDDQKIKVDNKIIELEAIDGIDEVNASLYAAKLEADKLKTVLNNAKTAQTAAEIALEAAEENAEKKAEALADAIAARDDFIAKNSGSTVDEATLLARIRELDDLERQYAYDVEDYHMAQSEFNNSIQSLYIAWQTAVAEYNTAYQNGTDEEELAVLRTACVNTEKAYSDAANNVPENLKSMQRALETSSINLQYKKQDLETLQQQYNNSQNYLNWLQDYTDAADNANTVKKAADKAVINAEKAKAESIKTVTEAETSYNDAKKMVELLTNADSLTSLKAESESLDAQIIKAETEKNKLEEKQSDLNTVIAETVSDSTLKSLQNIVTKAQNELAAEMEKNKALTEVVQMKLDTKKLQITEKEAEVEKIKTGDFTTEVKAPIAGVIANIKVAIGTKIQLNDPITDIQLIDKGYSITFTVTTEQAKRIKIGDKANIEYWWGNEISVTVESIKADPSNPAQSKIVTLNISGEIETGNNLSFTIGEKSLNYDSVVPNSAIREDNAGKFVLIVEAKNTPLGNRYTARRADIQVIATDDTSTAVSGITYGDFVITASTKPVIAGTQVRLIAS